jgi:hypothetical protein
LQNKIQVFLDKTINIDLKYKRLLNSAFLFGSKHGSLEILAQQFFPDYACARKHSPNYAQISSIISLQKKDIIGNAFPSSVLLFCPSLYIFRIIILKITIFV